MNPDILPPTTPTLPTTPAPIAPGPTRRDLFKKYLRLQLKRFWAISSTIMLFLLAPAIALTITLFLFQSYEVDGESMETTLQNHDRLIVDKIPHTLSRITKHAYIPNRGDIIIFNEDGLFDSSGKQEHQLIKRVIGIPGDRVVISEGQVMVYDRQHPDGFNPDKQGLYRITAATSPGNVDITLRDNQIFVLGDNRTNSADSHIFGPINSEQIIGRLTMRIFPINKSQIF